MGDRALLVEDPPSGPAAWANGLRAVDIDGVVDIVPAARTVMVTCRDEGALAVIAAVLDDVVGVEHRDEQDAAVEIPVVYDGIDLDAVARASGCTVDRVVELHSIARYEVAFCGFAPGFAYLTGLPPELHLPRRSSPRPRIAAGSVAIATEYSAVYPTASPGGWHLLGRTDVELWNPAREPPALLAPGASVRFTAR